MTTLHAIAERRRAAARSRLTLLEGIQEADNRRIRIGELSGFFGRPIVG